MRACVGFSRGKDFVSSFICWITKSSTSHTWIVYKDICFDSWMVLEAFATGYRHVPWEYFRKRNNIIKVVRPNGYINGGIKTAAKWLGSHYDYAGLIGMGVVMIGRILKKRWKNPFRSTKSQFCSESVARVLQSANYPGADQLQPDEITPKEIMDFLLKDGEEWYPN